MRASLFALLVLSTLAGCGGGGLVPYQPGGLIASDHDTGWDRSPLTDGHAAIAYDPDGCQGWLMDDGVEGYTGRRYDPKTGLPVCNGIYPPGTVVGDYRAHDHAFGDWVPTN